jgi:hypothetical protein
VGAVDVVNLGPGTLRVEMRAGTSPVVDVQPNDFMTKRGTSEQSLSFLIRTADPAADLVRILASAKTLQLSAQASYVNANNPSAAEQVIFSYNAVTDTLDISPATVNIPGYSGGGGGPATQLDANGTTLDINAIVDGEFLKRVGTTVVSAAVSGGAVLAADVTLNNAAIIAASTAQTVELLPAVADKWYMIVGGGVWSHIVSAYTNIAELKEMTIGYDNDNFDATFPVHGIIAGPNDNNLLDSSRYQAILPGSANQSAFNTGLLTYKGLPIDGIIGKNLALFIDNQNGDPDRTFTGGNAANTLKFRFFYQLLEA